MAIFPDGVEALWAPVPDSQQRVRGPWLEQRAGPCGWQGGVWLGSGHKVGRKQRRAASRARRQLRRKPWWGDPVIIKRNHLFWAGY